MIVLAVVLPETDWADFEPATLVKRVATAARAREVRIPAIVIASIGAS
jgi:hypothetical protein